MHGSARTNLTALAQTWRVSGRADGRESQGVRDLLLPVGNGFLGMTMYNCEASNREDEGSRLMRDLNPIVFTIATRILNHRSSHRHQLL